MNPFPASLTRGARMLERLSRTPPGHRNRMSIDELCDIEVPASMWDRQTPDFLANWLHGRMPFYCTLYKDPLGRYYEIVRPPHL